MTMRAQFIFSLCLSLGLALTSAACSKAPERRTFTLQGQVQSLDAPRKLVVVKHDEIKGFMPAMTMEFTVSAGDLALAKPGQRIRAEMVNVKDSDLYRLEKVWPADKVVADTVAAGHIVAIGQRVKMKLIMICLPRKRELCTTRPL